MLNNVRFYGRRPYATAVIHGGPGAPGEMAPVARELAPLGGVLEPLQTEPSLEGQVTELYEVLVEKADAPVRLVGHSWGAWLAYILAARFPDMMKKLVLVGAGPFEAKDAANILSMRLDRLGEAGSNEFREIIAGLDGASPADAAGLMERFGALMQRADTYDPLPHRSEVVDFSYEINQKVWAQAERLRASGALLEMGERIRCPVVAIHGDYDPHPAEGVRGPLTRVLKDFRFILLERCGHEPWIERWARDRFYELLRNELNLKK